MKSNNCNNILKLIAIISLLSLLAAILLAWLNPAMGYELDIYVSTPILTWIFLIIAMLGGVGIILHQILTKGYEASRLWYLGLLVLVLFRFGLLYIPYIRGYVSWNGDNIDYLGLIKDILQSGHFTSTNIYPVTPTFLSSVIYITGITDRVVANLSTALISVLFVFSVYLLIGVLSHNKKIQIISVLIAGSVMLTAGYNVILSPNGWSILFIPLLFYLYFHRSSGAYFPLLLIFLILYPLFHPLSALMVIIALSILELGRWLLSCFRGKDIKYGISSSTSLNVCILLEFIIFSTWILAHQQFNPNIRLLWDQITSGLGSGKMAQLEESLAKINVHGLDFYLLIFKMFGSDIILIGISVIGIFWLIKNYIKKTIQGIQNIIPLIGIFIIFGIFYAAYLLGLPGMTSLGNGQWDRRFLGYVEILIPLFSAVGLYTLFKTSHSRKLVYSCGTFLVLISSVLSIASLYNSPYISQPNDQITLMDMTGARWFIDKKDIAIGSSYIISPISNFAEGIIGSTATNQRIDISKNITQLPDHFGYSAYNNLGMQFSKDTYAVITIYDRTIYSTVWKQVGRFNNSDFAKLEEDSTVNKIYANNEMDIYYINASVSQG
jgi:hypothetical protein